MRVSLVTAPEAQAGQARRSSRPDGGAGQVYDLPTCDTGGSPDSSLHVERRSSYGRQFLPALTFPVRHLRKGAHDDAHRCVPASVHKGVEILLAAAKSHNE